MKRTANARQAQLRASVREEEVGDREDGETGEEGEEGEEGEAGNTLPRVNSRGFLARCGSDDEFPDDHDHHVANSASDISESELKEAEASFERKQSQAENLKRQLCRDRVCSISLVEREYGTLTFENFSQEDASGERILGVSGEQDDSIIDLSLHVVPTAATPTLSHAPADTSMRLPTLRCA